MPPDVFNPTETYTKPDSMSGMFPFSPRRCGCCRLWRDDFERTNIGPYYELIPGLSIEGGKAKVTSTMRIFRPSSSYGLGGMSVEGKNELFPFSSLNFPGVPNPPIIPEVSAASYGWVPSSGISSGGLLSTGFGSGTGQWQQCHFDVESDGEVFFGQFTSQSVLQSQAGVQCLSFDPTLRIVSVWSVSDSPTLNPSPLLNIQPEDWTPFDNGLPGAVGLAAIYAKLRMMKATITASPPWKVRVCFSNGYASVRVNGLSVLSAYMTCGRPEFYRSAYKGTYFTIDNLEFYAIGNQEVNYWNNGAEIVKSKDPTTGVVTDVGESGRDFCPPCSTGCWSPFGLSSDRTNQKIQVDISGWEYIPPNVSNYTEPGTINTPSDAYASRTSKQSCCESRNGTFVLTRVAANIIFPNLPNDFLGGGNAYHNIFAYQIPLTTEAGGLDAIKIDPRIPLPVNSAFAINGCAYYTYRNDFGCGEEDMILIATSVSAPFHQFFFPIPGMYLLYRNVSTGKIINYYAYSAIGWQQLGDNAGLTPYAVNLSGVNRTDGVIAYRGYQRAAAFVIQPYAAKLTAPKSTGGNISHRPITMTPPSSSILKDATADAFGRVWNVDESYTQGMLGNFQQLLPAPGFPQGILDSPLPEPRDEDLAAGEDHNLFGTITTRFGTFPITTNAYGTGGCGIRPNHGFNIKITPMPGDLGS